MNLCVRVLFDKVCQARIGFDHVSRICVHFRFPKFSAAIRPVKRKYEFGFFKLQTWVKISKTIFDDSPLNFLSISWIFSYLYCFWESGRNRTKLLHIQVLLQYCILLNHFVVYELLYLLPCLIHLYNFARALIYFTVSAAIGRRQQSFCELLKPLIFVSLKPAMKSFDVTTSFKFFHKFTTIFFSTTVFALLDVFLCSVKI